MSNIIYKSKNTIPWDTQSAFKMTSYNCHREENMVFCYLKGYVRGGDLVLCSYCFTASPEGRDSITLYLGLNPCEDKLLKIDFGFEGIGGLSVGSCPVKGSVDYSSFKANDEQGYYWCGQLVLSRGFIADNFSAEIGENSVITLNMTQNFADGDFSVLCGDASQAGYDPVKNTESFVVLNY